MNVNSSGKRIRRTPDEARALILKVAAARLAAHGLDGLNIAGVAKDAGMSHATVIHHFGSTGAMRQALLSKMTGELLSDVIEALDHNEPADQLLARLFSMLSRDGHGRLLAWLALDQQAFEQQQGSGSPLVQEQTGELFENIIRAIVSRGESASNARREVLLVAAAALGLSVSGDALAGLIGLSDDEMGDFPAWLADRIDPAS